MIKFFRKIRQRLLTENKFSKYLLYALGEIILVVIGILIALQINNWKEEHKEIQLEKQRYQNLITDLKKDKVSINKMIGELIQKQDLHYDLYEISQNAKTPDNLKDLSSVNSAPELHLVTGKNQLTDLASFKNLQIRKDINDYITLENSAMEDLSKLENIIKTRVRDYFHSINVVEIESVFVPNRNYNKVIRPSFDFNLLSQHFKETEFKGLLITLKLNTGMAIISLNSLKDINETLQNDLKNKL